MMKTRRCRLQLSDQNPVDGILHMSKDLISEEVFNMAVDFHAELQSMMASYGSDQIIVNIIPTITKTLERLDAVLKINSDYIKIINDNVTEVDLLKLQLKKEKEASLIVLDESIAMENGLRREIMLKNDAVVLMKKEVDILTEKLSEKVKVLKELKEDNERLRKELRDFKFKIIKNNGICSNSKFSSKIPTDKASGGPVRNHRVILLADSHGRLLYDDIKTRLSQRNIDMQAWIRPGARLNDVVKIHNFETFAADLTMEDAVIVIGGTCDIKKFSPYQYTIFKAFEDIERLAGITNVIMTEIFNRYDEDFGEDIMTANDVIRQRCKRLSQGGSNISFLEVNKSLNRSNFTRHGLHLSRTGKSVLASTIAKSVGAILNNNGCAFNNYIGHRDRSSISAVSRDGTSFLGNTFDSDEFSTHDESVYLTVDEWQSGGLHTSPTADTNNTVGCHGSCRGFSGCCSERHESEDFLDYCNRRVLMK